MAGGTPGKHCILNLNQRGCRLHFGKLVCLFPSTNEPRHPYLSVGVVGIAFAVPAIEGRANPLHLIKSGDHMSVIKLANQPASFFINVWSDA
jgi:hypothetical protein